MSKDGPSIARWALGIMTDTVLLYNPNIKVYYNGVKQRTGRGSYAHVLVMKKFDSHDPSHDDYGGELQVGERGANRSKDLKTRCRWR